VRRYPHVRWISEPDRGQSDAVNKAIARSRGQIIAWINADDFHQPGAFAAVVEAFAVADADCPAVAGAVAVIDAAGTPIETHRPRFDGIEPMLAFWEGGYGLCQPGVFFRRGAFDRSGPLRTDLHYAMDYDLWLRMARLGRIRTLDRVLAAYVVHPRSKSGRARFGEGFNEELEAVSRMHWGPAWTRRHRRLRRACSRFIAEQHMNALVYAHKHHSRIDRSALARIWRRRPVQLLHRHVLAVAAERLLGAGRWTRTRQAVRRLMGAAHT
jgi:glycosyltransferase involved in cell wall biosynthesis